MKVKNLLFLILNFIFISAFQKVKIKSDSTLSGINNHLTGNLYIPNWFLIIFLILLIIFLFIIISRIGQFRLNVLESRKEKLEILVQERTDALLKEKEKVEKLLEKSEKAKNELKQVTELRAKLINVAVHDLKNPLQSIIGFQFLTNERKDIDDELKEVLSVIFKSSQKMFNIINDILESASYEHSTLYLNKEIISLSELTKEVIEQNYIRINQKMQTLHTSLDNNIYINVDKIWFSKAVDNILSNAVKYSDLNKSITIKTYKDNSFIYIEIIDEGPGIPENEISNLFNQFYKINVMPTGGETSTGLGLYITKDIIERHDGFIDVKSKINVGSSFKICIPY